MKILSKLDHRIAGATLQLPEPYQATMPPHWANAHGGLAVQPQVGEARPPHSYKPLILLAEPLPHRQETFCLSTKSWGQVDLHNFYVQCLNLTNNHSIVIYMSRRCQWTPHLPHPSRY